MDSTATLIYAKQKSRIFSGPKLDEVFRKGNILYLHPCTTAFNSTHFFMVGYSMWNGNIDFECPGYRKVGLVEFKTQKIRDFPCLEFDLYADYNISSCLVFSSKRDSKLVTHLQTSPNPESYVLESYIMSYDLNSGQNGHWETHQRVFVTSKISK